MACRILVPQPGIQLGPPAVEAQSPYHWTTREFPTFNVKKIKIHMKLYICTERFLYSFLFSVSSDQFSRSVAQSCPIVCDPMNRSTPGLPVHHQLPEFTHTHVHRVSDAIQPSHPLSSSFPPAPNPSQHQSLFQ